LEDLFAKGVDSFGYLYFDIDLIFVGDQEGFYFYGDGFGEIFL
jgi:hypothetical protein